MKLSNFKLINNRPLFMIALSLACIILICGQFLKFNGDKLNNEEYFPAYGRICDSKTQIDSKTSKYTVDSVSYNNNGQIVELLGKTEIFSVKNYYEYNDVIYFEGKFSNLEEKYEKSSYARNIFYRTQAKNIVRIKNLGQDFYSHVLTLRKGIEEIIYNLYPSDVAGIVLGLITGNKEGIEETTLLAFRFTGISHLLAVSGLHVGVIVAALYYLLKKLKIAYYPRYVITVLALMFYLFLAGFTPSLLRASIMILCLITSKLLRKHMDSLSVLSGAAIIILIINPLSVYSVGFQLSFSAVFGILTLSHIARRFIKKPKFLSEGVGATFGATVLTLPVSAYNFGVVYPLSIVTNIFAVPLASAAIIISAISVILGAIFLPLGTPFAFASMLVIWLLDFLSKIISTLLFCEINFIGVSFITIVLMFTLALILSPYCLLKKSKQLTSAFVIFIICIFSVLLNLIK